MKHIQNKPDLVILDILIPEPDGWEICRAIRYSQEEEIQKIPILILSALGEEENWILVLQFSADDYLAKPFSLRKLILRIDKLLRIKKDYQLLQLNLSSLTVKHEEKTLHIRDLIHDLKNSFLAFQSLCGILERKNLDVRQEEQIRYAVRESRQSIEKLLSLLWHTSKGGSLSQDEEDSYSLSEVIQSLVERYQPLASEKGVFLSSQISSLPPVSFQGKMAGIRRAIENIIDNALKYTGKEGRIDIQVECLKGAEKEVKVSTSSGELIRITVTDTGIGIHPERLRELMKGSNPSVTMAEHVTVSFGHRLSFVKRVAAEIKGNLSIESEPQKGTKVTLTFCIDTTPLRRRLLSEV